MVIQICSVLSHSNNQIAVLFAVLSLFVRGRVPFLWLPFLRSLIKFAVSSLLVSFILLVALRYLSSDP